MVIQIDEKESYKPDVYIEIQDGKIKYMSKRSLAKLFSVLFEGVFNDAMNCYEKTFWIVKCDESFYCKLKDNSHNQKFEDNLAECLYSGGAIYLYDTYSDGDVYSELGTLTKDESQNDVAMYTVRIKDITRGIEKCLGNPCDEFVFNVASNFVQQNDCFDYYYADALLQMIVFGEFIYG